MAYEFELGIQSYCFRKFQPLEKLIDALKTTGLSYVELWPGHQSLDAGEATLRGALADFAESGITVNSCGVVPFARADESARAALAFCKMAGIGAIGASVDPDRRACAELEALCDEYDVNLAIHNHGRKDPLGTIAALEEIFSRTSRRFGLCLDTGWLLDVGDDPFEAIEKFEDRLYGVHLKDFAYGADGSRRDVIIGTGGLDLPRLMGVLKDIEFRGFLSLEYEGDADDPIPNVKKCIQAVREATAGL